MTWVKLEVGNNWGELFYRYPSDRLNASGTNETAHALVLAEGLETAVRFPDDWGAVVRLVSQQLWIPLEAVEVVHGFACRVCDLKEKA